MSKAEYKFINLDPEARERIVQRNCVRLREIYPNAPEEKIESAARFWLEMAELILDVEYERAEEQEKEKNKGNQLAA